MNKLTKQTVYVPCGNQVTHFKVKCDPDDEGNYMQCNVKKEENKYVLSEEELRALIKKIIWSADWDKVIHNLFNDEEDFYCHDECCANAQEDYDFKKCTIQCDKCKEE
jgi:hypothetical protein